MLVESTVCWEDGLWSSRPDQQSGTFGMRIRRRWCINSLNITKDSQNYWGFYENLVFLAPKSAKFRRSQTL